MEKVSEYRRLISIPGGKLRKGVTIEQGLSDGLGGPVKRISLSESQLSATVRASPTSIVG